MALLRHVAPAALAALVLCACGEKRTSYRDNAEDAAAAITRADVEKPLAALAADDMRGRDNLTEGGKRARAYIVDALRALGLEPAGRGGSFEQPFGKGVNIVARLRGRDDALADEHVLLGAHYDHLGDVCAKGADTLCNGATDNAAGVAAVLAVAGALARSERGTRRSLLVVLWDAEEDGLLGSKHYVDKDAIVPLDKIVSVVNIDAVGATILPGASSSFGLGVEYAEGLRELIHANNAVAGYTIRPVSSYFDGSANGRRSDHLPFREANVPTVWLSSGAPAEYHTPADELSIVDYDKVLGVARHALLVSADIADSDAPPRFVATPRPHIDDAVAMHELGGVVLKDPAAIGLDNKQLVRAVQSWVDQLADYIAKPPQSDAQWAEYEKFIKDILAAVYAFLPGR